MNYNNEPEMFKKGSVIYRAVCCSVPFLRRTPNWTKPTEYEGANNESKFARVEDLLKAEPVDVLKTQAEKERKRQAKATIRVEHLDIIRDDFWGQRPWLLSSKAARSNVEP